MSGESVESLIRSALTTDGAHHKQWYIEQIAAGLGIDISSVDYERGIP